MNLFGMGGAQQSGTATTTQAPPAYMQPYIGTGLQQAAGLLNGPAPQFYPGKQVADFSQPQEQAFSGMSGFDRGLMGGSGNPFEDAMFQHMAGATQNQLSSEFAGGGRNVAASEPLRAEQLNNLATGFYGNQYQNDVQNAFQAGGNLLGIGNQIQQKSQNDINANMAKFNYYQNLPQQQLSRYQQNVNAFNPGQTTQQPIYSNPLATGLGMAQLYQQLFGGSGGQQPLQLNSVVDSSSLNQPPMPIGYSGPYQ